MQKITNSYALAMLLMASKDETLNANISVENGCTGTKTKKRPRTPRPIHRHQYSIKKMLFKHFNSSEKWPSYTTTTDTGKKLVMQTFA